jgi:hypothetical protein
MSIRHNEPEHDTGVVSSEDEPPPAPVLADEEADDADETLPPPPPTSPPHAEDDLQALPDPPPDASPLGAGDPEQPAVRGDAASPTTRAEVTVDPEPLATPMPPPPDEPDDPTDVVSGDEAEVDEPSTTPMPPPDEPDDPTDVVSGDEAEVDEPPLPAESATDPATLAEAEVVAYGDELDTELEATELDDDLEDGDLDEDDVADESAVALTAAATKLVTGGPAFHDRWDLIQVDFVDDPRQAVERADGLVGDVVDEIMRALATEREQLGGAWRDNSTASTEDLRLAFQRYRTVFQRLLQT